jgi:hypothetical protein
MPTRQEDVNQEVFNMETENLSFSEAIDQLDKGNCKIVEFAEDGGVDSRFEVVDDNGVDCVKTGFLFPIAWLGEKRWRILGVKDIKK